MMDLRINHVWSNMNAELADGKDAECVSDNCERDDKGHEDCFVKRRAQYQMRGHEACEEQRQGGSDAAALGGDHKGYSRKPVIGVFADERGAGYRKKQLGDIRRSMLEEAFDGVKQRGGERRHEDEHSKRQHVAPGGSAV